MTSLFDQSTTSFDQVDRAERASAFPTYLTRMAVDLAAVKPALAPLLPADEDLPPPQPDHPRLAPFLGGDAAPEGRDVPAW